MMDPQATIADCVAPKCPTGLFGNMTKRAWQTQGKSEQSIRKDHKDYPGANMSVDQMETTTLGLVPQSTRKLLTAKYSGATVFVDHHSNFTYLHLMTSLDGEQTMAAKVAYEQLAQNYGISMQGYQADNGQFEDKGWHEDCTEQQQALTFCGVRAHHQNGIAKKRIRDLSEGARTSLLHAMQ